MQDTTRTLLRQMISHVVLWTNGLVMAFDENGEQMPEYQGPFTEKVRLIYNRNPNAHWQIGEWEEWLSTTFVLNQHTISKEDQ